MPRDREYEAGVRAYKHFIVQNGKAIGGWEYLEDARDELRAMKEEERLGDAKIVARSRLGTYEIDPKRPFARPRDVKSVGPATRPKTRGIPAGHGKVITADDIFGGVAKKVKKPLRMARTESALWGLGGAIFVPANAHFSELAPWHGGLASRGAPAPRDPGTRGIEASWKSAKEAMGGAHLEVVRLVSGNILLVDEDGLMKRLPLNSIASSAAAASSIDAIVGDAVFVPKHLARKALG
jgi:hypothetical protein